MPRWFWRDSYLRAVITGVFDWLLTVYEIVAVGYKSELLGFINVKLSLKNIRDGHSKVSANWMSIGRKRLNFG